MSSASASTAPPSPRSASTGGWMPRTTDAQLAERGLAGRPGLRDHLLGRLGVGVHQALGHAEAHRHRDQPGLRAVVEVALDPAQLGRGVVDRVGAGLGQPLHPLLEHLGVAVGQHPAVHVGARLHDRLDAVVPERPGHDQDQQQHRDQRRPRTRRCTRPPASPGRARSSGPAPSRSPCRSRRARCGRYWLGIGVPSTSAAIRRCSLAIQRQLGTATSRKQEADHDHREHAADER